jgi:hypothetical protein
MAACRMAGVLLVVAIGHAMSPPRVLSCEKIHPFHPKGTSFGAHFVPLFLSHSTRIGPRDWQQSPRLRCFPRGKTELKKSPRGSGPCVLVVRGLPNSSRKVDLTLGLLFSLSENVPKNAPAPALLLAILRSRCTHFGQSNFHRA